MLASLQKRVKEVPLRKIQYDFHHSQVRESLGNFFSGFPYTPQDLIWRLNLVGGFNPFEKYEWNWKSSPIFGVTKTVIHFLFETTN